MDDDEDDDDEEELPEVSVTKKKSERQLELEQGDDYKIGKKNWHGRPGEEGGNGVLAPRGFQKSVYGGVNKVLVGGHS